MEPQNHQACRSEEIIAYLDGELDAQACALLEAHFTECVLCDGELKAQQRLLRELDFALTEDVCVEMPKDFAQVVALRAQSDLSGLRTRRESRRALRLCAGLAIAAFALLGGAAMSESVFSPLRAIWKCLVTIFSFLGHALYDLGTGLAVISRGVGKRILFESRASGLLAFLLFASALFMLRRLIAGYHRTRTVE